MFLWLLFALVGGTVAVKVVSEGKAKAKEPESEDTEEGDLETVVTPDSSSSPETGPKCGTRAFPCVTKAQAMAKARAASKAKRDAKASDVPVMVEPAASGTPTKAASMAKARATAAAARASKGPSGSIVVPSEDAGAPGPAMAFEKAASGSETETKSEAIVPDPTDLETGPASSAFAQSVVKAPSVTKGAPVAVNAESAVDTAFERRAFEASEALRVRGITASVEDVKRQGLEGIQRGLSSGFKPGDPYYAQLGPETGGFSTDSLTQKLFAWKADESARAGVANLQRLYETTTDYAKKARYLEALNKQRQQVTAPGLTDAERAQAVSSGWMNPDGAVKANFVVNPATGRASIV